MPNSRSADWQDVDFPPEVDASTNASLLEIRIVDTGVRALRIPNSVAWPFALLGLGALVAASIAWPGAVLMGVLFTTPVAIVLWPVTHWPYSVQFRRNSRAVRLYLPRRLSDHHATPESLKIVLHGQGTGWVADLTYNGVVIARTSTRTERGEAVRSFQSFAMALQSNFRFDAEVPVLG